MNLRNLLISFGFLAATAVPAQADLPTGLWQSKPDRSGLVVHVRAKPCGPVICGRIERAKDTRGYDLRSDTVGQKMFWDMALQGDGTYVGQFFDPREGRKLTARMKVDGNQMRLQRCDGAVCRDEVWRRLR